MGRGHVVGGGDGVAGGGGGGRSMYWPYRWWSRMYRPLPMVSDVRYYFWLPGRMPRDGGRMPGGRVDGMVGVQMGGLGGGGGHGGGGRRKGGGR